MEGHNLIPFRIAKYFEEHVPQMLEALSADPDGMYQVVYRVGDLMISAQVWREPQEVEFCPEYSETDQEFLRQLNISPNEGRRV